MGISCRKLSLPRGRYDLSDPGEKGTCTKWGSDPPMPLLIVDFTRIIASTTYCGFLEKSLAKQD
jgi:hypothetical protein